MYLTEFKYDFGELNKYGASGVKTITKFTPQKYIESINSKIRIRLF